MKWSFSVKLFFSDAFIAGVADVQVYFVVLMSHGLRDTLLRFWRIDASCYIFVELFFAWIKPQFLHSLHRRVPETYFKDQRSYNLTSPSIISNPCNLTYLSQWNDL